MIESILLFLSAYLLTWPALVVILILGVLAEHFDSPKMSVLLGLVSGGIAYTLFDVTLSTLGIIAGSYLVVGFLWSFWRYTRFVSSGVKYIKSRFLKGETQAAHIKQLAPSENIGKIVRWVLIWPLSFAGSITGDVINLIQKLVTEVFHKVYAKIFTAYTKDI